MVKKRFAAGISPRGGSLDVPLRLLEFFPGEAQVELELVSVPQI